MFLYPIKLRIGLELKAVGYRTQLTTTLETEVCAAAAGDVMATLRQLNDGGTAGTASPVLSLSDFISISVCGNGLPLTFAS